MKTEDFNFLSENFTDKVSYVKEGQVSYPTGTSGNYVDVPVPSTTLQLPSAVISKDGITWVSVDAPRYGYNGTGIEMQADIYWSPSNVRLFITAHGYTGTIYYRIMGVKK